MKIAHICQSYPPMVSGQSIFVKRLAEKTARQGHEVAVICASDTTQSYLNADNGVKTFRFRSFNNPLRAQSRVGVWPQRYIQEQILRYQPDVIHLHDPVTTGIAGVNAAQELNIPALLTIHQLPWFITANLPSLSFLKDFIEDRLWEYSRSFSGKCHALVTPTYTIADIVGEKLNVQPYVISGGIDLNNYSDEQLPYEEKLRLCEEMGLDPAKPIVLHVGRLDKDKQVGLVVKTAAEAMKHLDVQFLIVGDGQEKSGLMNLARRLDIADRVTFTGYIANNGLLSHLYRLADLFMMVSEIETQGLVLLEAAASGLPIVAVNASCVPEIVIHGLNGFLAPPGDISKLCDYILWILAQPKLTRHMAIHSRQEAEMHDLNITVEKYISLYTQLLDR